MRDLFTPDFMFGHFYEITPEFLIEHGIRALLIDIDNTLAPYEMPDPSDEIIGWFRLLNNSGIQAALISNNHKERVERFNKPLGLIAFHNSGKPKSKRLIQAMSMLNSTISDTAVLGDQLLTDSYAGKRLGLRSLIVPPIRDKTNLFFRFKRRLERKFIRRYAKEHGYESWMSFWKIKTNN